MRTIGVGLLGLGNVGSGVVKLLDDNQDAITSRLGARVAVQRIAVREADKPRLVDVDHALITTDVEAVIADPAVDVVVELVGGEELARRYVLSAIAKKKHVVTANKALLAVHGDEIFDAAEAAGVNVFYEASVCGGVPIIRALRDGLASDRIDQIIGIVNGTSNYILTRMVEEGLPFDEVLQDAQAKGFAEADPALDVDGWDAAHKLCILVSLCFGVRVKLSDVKLVDGLRPIRAVDIAYAERFGYVIKPLVIGRDHGETVEARVHPTMIPRRFLLAGVSGVFNAVYVSSQALGPSMYYGRGAGMMPTAVAVVSDVIDGARDILAAAHSGVPMRLRVRDWHDRPIRDAGDLESRYYLRAAVIDKPGVLAQLARVLGDRAISIREVVQSPDSDTAKGSATIVLTTHMARERDMQAALADFAKLDVVVEPPCLIRILD